MATNESQAEPSMEEILASIRRIIAEDEPKDGADDAEEVLDLSEPAEAEAEAAFEQPAEPAFTPEPEPEPEPANAVADDDDDLVFEVAEEERAPAPAPQPAPAAKQSREEAILSDAVANATAGALARLAGSLRVSDKEGQSLEGIVRELLKPMLKEWLDENLPEIVEAKVEAAIDKVIRQAR